ncbi:Glutathione synthetase [Strongyloides ratti]|uniref:Glutathione synthetase n=1 Tax=Strongyloides ratti TaxID=34506 RepID=A0A090MS50_STRRB|nr:Glutathione synthetase [Strongyloides ratti]CEF61078.1 Glutathione synthetase [Strongyloides ratti]
MEKIISIEKKSLIEYAKDFALLNGLSMRTREHPDSSDTIEHAPFTLFPSYFDETSFYYVKNLQKHIQMLYYKVSQDIPFLIETHKDIVNQDNLIKGLCNVLIKSSIDPSPQQFNLILQRSDYMPHVNSNNKIEIKQVEVNNIAVSMGGLGNAIENLHRNILNIFFKDVILNQEDIYLPEKSNPAKLCAEGLVTALKYYHIIDYNDNPKRGMLLYGNSLPLNCASILTVTEDVSRNIFDQRHIEAEIQYLTNYNVKNFRIPLSQLNSRLTLDENKKLFLDKKYEIGLVYYRTGYSIDQYNDETNDWDTRLLIEKSAAIKCPSIGLQLANTKKMQQVLANKCVLKKYVYDDEVVEKIFKSFAKLWPLGGDSDEEKLVIKDAKSNPDKYVLKPQTEGGGGNFFGKDIPNLLNSLSKTELKCYILMEKLHPTPTENFLIRPNQKVEKSQVVSELGIYGWLIADKKNIFPNRNSTYYSYMMRTKESTTNEGGICVGAACLDSIIFKNFEKDFYTNFI